MVVRGVVFELYNHRTLPRELFWLMKEFRLMVNKAIRVGLEKGLTSRNSICQVVYKRFRKEHDVYSQYIPSACEVAASILKNYRKGVRKGLRTRTPYAKRLSLKCENQTYKLDRRKAIIRLPIRAGKHVKLKLAVSDYHLRYLENKELHRGSLTICPNNIIIAFRKDFIKDPKFKPETVISLDTNERSIDGIFVEPEGPLPITMDMSKIPVLQERHHERRRRLQKKKGHDRRTQRRLCGREGRREHNRVEAILHNVANRLVDIAIIRKSAIILEDLTGLRPSHYDKVQRRRISSWPRRKLHQFIEYKAEWNGVPVIKVDPRYTSRTCPVCGRIRYDSRKDKVFRCGDCGWECDDHINASLNILGKAMSLDRDVARAVKGRPDASWHDPMRSLYDLETGARTEANRMSGRMEI